MGASVISLFSFRNISRVYFMMHQLFLLPLYYKMNINKIILFSSTNQPSKPSNKFPYEKFFLAHINGLFKECKRFQTVVNSKRYSLYMFKPLTPQGTTRFTLTYLLSFLHRLANGRLSLHTLRVHIFSCKESWKNKQLNVVK